MGRKERRNYIRISTVLPVEFFLAGKEGEKITPWLQGFTRDIGKGGICLTVNDLWWGFWDKFSQPGNKVFLRLSLPLKKEPLFLKASIKWLDSKKLKRFQQYKVGLEFTGAKKRKQAPLFKFALFKKATPIAAALVLSLFLLVSGALFWRKTNLIRQNQQLVRAHGEILQRNSYLARALEESQKAEEFFIQRKESLTYRIGGLQQAIFDLESQHKQLKQIREKDKEQLKELAFMEAKLSELNQELKNLNRENEFLKEQIAEKEKVTAEIRKEAEEIKLDKHILSQEVIAGMYDWIRHRQDLVRGLVLSYEGDSAMSQVCFTYDQALSIFVFLNFGENNRAEKILDFYLNEVNQGREIYNGYFTDGSVFEYVLHSGPQAWLGLAALDYTRQTNDKKYLRIAEQVAEFLVQMQDHEGGIVGGPGLKWYSTEHNLDAYAFFRAFYKLTGNSRHKQKSLKIRDWISRHAYTDYKIPIKRGKGDATIATDTYAWSITSLGPETLYSMGMDPEVILEFAAKKCKVTVNFRHQDNREVRVEGFDFAKARNIGRGGVVSGEWTAQMILAYVIMADYFTDKDSQKQNKYLQKAHFYFNQLQKMIITSPSRAGRVDPSLPYASAPLVSTGHGWRTPAGDRTGSLASTAYFLIAYYGYNPLRLEHLEVSFKRQPHKAKKPHL